MASLGFTGTRYSLSRRRTALLYDVLRELRGEDGDGQKFHHGCCRGADAAAASIAKAMGYRIHAHPPTVADWVDSQSIIDADVIHPAKPYMKRNEAIVRSCGTIIAVPLSETEDSRSGSWATVRRARKMGRRIIVVTDKGVDYQ